MSDTDLAGNKTANGKPNRKLIIATVVIAILFVIGYFNLNRFVVGYVYLFKTDSFSKGDKVYASGFVIKGGGFSALKALRPITANEVTDSVFANKNDRDDFMYHINTDKLIPYVQNFNIVVHNDKLKKNGSAAIGTYVGTHIMHTKTLNGKGVLGVFYEIEPDTSIRDNHIYKSDVPRYYKFANNNIYLPPSFATNKETIKE